MLELSKIDLSTLARYDEGEILANYDVNLDFLRKGIVKKYTIGVGESTKGQIANAYVIDPETNSIVKVNPKNSLLIALEFLAYQYNNKDTSLLFNPEQRMHLLMQALMPSPEVCDIDSVFFKRLLQKGCRRDDIRNCRTGIPYQACFSYITVNRYKPVSRALSKQYTEEQVKDIAEEIYYEVATPYLDANKMTPVNRAVISETVDLMLQEQTGWSFSHREYTDMQVNEKLIERIIAAFPANELTYKQLQLVLGFDAAIKKGGADAGTVHAITDFVIDSINANPLLGNPSWQRMMKKEQRFPFDVIADNFFEEAIKLESEERRKYINEVVDEWVTAVNDKRLQQTSFIREDASERDRFLDYKKDISQVATFLDIRMTEIENSYFNNRQFDKDAFMIFYELQIASAGNLSEDERITRTTKVYNKILEKNGSDFFESENYWRRKRYY